MQAASREPPPLPAELATDSAALEQLRLLLTGGAANLHPPKNTDSEPGTQTRSGRISRRPHHPPASMPAQPSEASEVSEDPRSATVTPAPATAPAPAPVPAPTTNENGQLPKPKRGPGRPVVLTEEERLRRRRARNKEAAVQSRRKRKAKLEQAAETEEQLEERTKECEALRDRCAQLEARINQLQAQIVGLGHTPAPATYAENIVASATPQSGDDSTPARSPTPTAATTTVNTTRIPSPAPPAAPTMTSMPVPQPPPPLSPSALAVEAATQAAAAVLSSGFNASAFATPSSFNPTPAATVLTPLTDAAMATHALQTEPVDLTGAYTGFEGGDDYDTMSLSALFTFDDLPEDAADEDFVPPTSPKPGESSSDEEDEDEDEEEEEGDAGGGEGDTPKGDGREGDHRGHKRTREEYEDEAQDEAEDLFLPIRDVPIPLETVYSEAMAALGVRSKSELASLVSRIVQGASGGHLSPDQIEVLRRLMVIAESQGMYAEGTGHSSSSSR